MTTQAENIATLARKNAEAAPRQAPEDRRAARAEAEARAAIARNNTRIAKAHTRAVDAVSQIIERPLPTRDVVVKAGGYSNAKSNRLNAYSLGISGSPDLALDQTDLDNLRRASQEAVRNHPIARAIIARLVGMCAPERVSFQARTSSPEYNRYIEAAFRDWWENQADFRGVDSGPDLLRQVQEAAAVDGDIGINLVYSDRGPQIQLVAGERIATPFSVMTKQLACGVEYDAAGRIAAYRVCDWNQWGSLDFGSSQRLSSRHFILARNWRHLRPGQSRGEPLLSGCLHLIEQLSELKAAILVAARIGACFSVLVYSENPAEKQAAMLTALDEAGDVAGDNDRDANTQVMRPGGMLHMKTGEKVEQLKPEFPSDSVGAFIVSTLREIGADVGLPIEAYVYDTTETTFYGGKAAMAISQHETIRTWQNWVKPIMTRIFRFWSDASVASGTLKDHPERNRHVWVSPPAPAYDEKEAVETGLLKVAHNLMSKAELCQQVTGNDLVDVQDARAAETQRETDMGITPPALPGSSATQDAAAKSGDKSKAKTGGPAKSSQEAAP